jgi:hypothetical protein
VSDSRISGAHADTWVPVEHRWFGLDKRTIAPGLIAIALMAVLIVVLPAINEAIEYDRQIQAGDVVNLGAGITFVPAVSWGFPNGLLVSDQTVGGTEASANLNATLINGAVEFAATTGPFTGTADELLKQIDKLNEAYKSIDTSKAMSAPGTLTTSTGLTGVGQAFSGVNVEGVIAAFVVDGIGVQFVAHGPQDTLLATIDDIAAMIDSLATANPEVGS